MTRIDDIHQALKGRLRPGLYEHCIRTSTCARELARRHGVEEDKSVRAALWHDAYKEWPAADQVARARELGILTPDLERHPQILHGPLAAAALPDDFGERDPDVLAAIARHTTGDPDMTRLDMIVYLADLIEPGRDFSGVDALRARAAVALEAAMLAALEHTIRYLLDRGAWIHPKALAARNALLRYRE